MLCAVTGYSLISGMCTDLDTLVSQAYGAKLYKAMGLHCQRAIAILSLCSILVTAVWFQTELILRDGLGIDAEVSRLAGVWAKILSASLWPGIVSEILGKLLLCQQVVWPILISSIMGAIANMVSTHILVHVFHQGFHGCVIGFVISKWTNFLVMTCTIIFRKQLLKISLQDYYNLSTPKLEDSVYALPLTVPTKYEMDCSNANSDIEIEASFDDYPNDFWPTPSAEIFQHWSSFLKLGIPGAASLCIEW